MPLVPFESKWIEQTLGLPPKGEGPVSFSAISTDSRNLPPGCLFVPLIGDQFDGHSFLEQALQNGAAAALCSKSFKTVSPQDNAKVFRVDDTLAAYRKLAHAWRGRFQIPVIAIAGSVGKTTSKELLSSILRGKWPQTLQTRGSENGFIGIPKTLLELRDSHQAAVIEVGIDEVGAMQAHLDIVEPQASIVTAIGPEHLEKLGDIETVAREECLALTWVAGRGGFVSVNLDEPRIRDAFQSWKKGRTGLSFAEYTLDAAKASPHTLVGKILGAKLHVSGLNFESFELDLPLPGPHNARNLLGAISVALGMGLIPQEIRAGLATFSPMFGRSDLKKLSPGLVVLCDYYNANPTSVEAALEVVQAETAQNPSLRRWVCLGDMLELGSGELAFHTGLAGKLREVLDRKHDELLLFGPRMKSLQTELGSQPETFRGNVRHFSTQAELGQALKESLLHPSFVLIKGSRSMKMESVFQILEQALSQQSSQKN